VRIYLRKTSLVDYPGKVAAALFLPGCDLRCPWCHNGDLLEDGEDGLSLEDALGHIEKRRPVLGGVVLSGGEPALYPGLPALIRRIKALGLPVKLDTNGMNPGVLEALLADETARPGYIALDLKLSPSRYGAVLRAPGPAPEKSLEKSAALIRDSGIPHEFRTLILPPGFITGDDVAALAPLTDGAPWYFRPFRPGNCLDPSWNSLEPAGKETAETLIRRARLLGKNPILRG
jgi:pyruvate formate lyase activating enzyme